MDVVLDFGMLGRIGMADDDGRGGAVRPVPAVDAVELRAPRDRAALAALLERHAPSIASLCHAMSPAGDGRDATQEALERIVRHVGRFDATKGPFRTWAFQVARNVCRDRLRRRRPAADHDVDALPADLPDPEGALDARDGTGRVAAALEALPDGMRRALVLYHLEGRSIAEIAGALGVPQGTVMTWLHRGRRRLRELVEGGEARP